MELQRDALACVLCNSHATLCTSPSNSQGQWKFTTKSCTRCKTLKVAHRNSCCSLFCLERVNSCLQCEARAKGEFGAKQRILVSTLAWNCKFRVPLHVRIHPCKARKGQRFLGTCVLCNSQLGIAFYAPLRALQFRVLGACEFHVRSKCEFKPRTLRLLFTRIPVPSNPC